MLHASSLSSKRPQARRDGGVGGKLLRAPRRLGSPAVGQKYKVRQNVPFWKKN